ncbi:MAG TPA: hypothetical protein PKC39_14440 [Ferruginibacter sp.]|nr:hypothetical protein [Ferruginibacter sp.]HMP22154.1 hypothetical protein [Ferruginibacter sp.]
MKKLLMLCWLLLLAAAVAFVFWQKEWQYQLPTPVPLNYTEVLNGTPISHANLPVHTDGKPVFLHFFNPGCPCSRFNIPHFNMLYTRYHQQVHFITVVMQLGKYTTTEIQDMLGVPVPVSFDTALAAKCGVYSTPQAAIVGVDGKLFYKGNYNKSRYCTEPSSNYAQMALDALLKNSETPYAGIPAIKSYGCPLPVCTK